MSEALNGFNRNLLDAVGTLRACSRKIWSAAKHNRKITDDVRAECFAESSELSQHAGAALIAYTFLNWSYNKKYIEDKDILDLQEAEKPIVTRQAQFDDIVIKPVQFRQTIQNALGQCIAISNKDLISQKTGTSHMPAQALNGLQTAYYLMSVSYEGSVNNMLRSIEQCAVFDAAYIVQKDLFKDDIPDVNRYTLRDEFMVMQNYYENNRFQNNPQMHTGKDKALAFNTRIWAGFQYIKPQVSKPDFLKQPRNALN